MSSSPFPPPRLIRDEIWSLVEPLIPVRPPAAHGRTGRQRTSDRDVLKGMVLACSRPAATGPSCPVSSAGQRVDLLAADARMGRPPASSTGSTHAPLDRVTMLVQPDWSGAEHDSVLVEPILD